MSEFDEIFEEILTQVRPKKIVEVGSEYGGSTKILLNYAAQEGAYLDVVDPSPYTDLSEVFKGFEKFYTHHKELSVKALENLKADIYFLDGDHNYWTVMQELRHIYMNNNNAWVVMHDVGFPCGTRDLYYAPETIPANEINDFSYDLSINEKNELSKYGFNGGGNFAFAKKNGGSKNGVLTAISDFLVNRDDLYFRKIDPIFGLGVICPVGEKSNLDKIMDPYNNKLMRRMEANRMQTYIRLIEVQNEYAEFKNNLNKNLFFKVLKKLKVI